jgi:hypothetical protein
MECPICKDTISETETPFWTPCCHAFHAQCIRKWTSINPSCPVCRQSVDATPAASRVPAAPRESLELFSIADLIRDEFLSAFYSPSQVDALVYYSNIDPENDDDTIMGEVVFDPSQIASS